MLEAGQGDELIRRHMGGLATTAAACIRDRLDEIDRGVDVVAASVGRNRVHSPTLEASNGDVHRFARNNSRTVLQWVDATVYR